MATNLDIAQLDYKSAHDDLFIVGDSDGSSAVDFKYVVDVFANNKQLVRVKIFPDPNNSKCYFNMSNVVSNEMKFDWFEPNGQVFVKELNDSGEIYLPVQVRLGTDVSGVTTLNLASGQIIVTNSIPNLFGRRVSDTSYLDNITKKFLTHRDKLNLKSNYGEDLYVGASVQDSDYLRIYQYNNAGTLLVSGNITVPATATSNIFQMNISPTALTDFGVTFNASCVYYELVLSNDIMFLDKVRVYFDCNPKYEVINLHFMNNYGVFDTARFECVSRLSMDVQRKTFEKPDYRYGNIVNFYTEEMDTNRQYFESKINYGSQYQWSYKLTMNFPNDTEYKWLAELLMAPQIWGEIRYDDNSKEYYAVSVKATNYEYSKHINNGLRAFEVEIDMNQKRNGFRR